MSDTELIARLRSINKNYELARGVHVDIRQAADRIEALEAKLALKMFERDEAWKRAAHAEKMWGEVEVKLAKAVEAAEEMSAAFYSNGNVTERHLMACKAGVKLDATLAEIKGGKDDDAN